MAITLTSSAFTEGAMIPRKHTCDAEDTSPDLKWSGVPKEAKSLALICDDPDAPVGTWVHWVVWNLPGTTTEIAEGALPAGVAEGHNGWGRSGWGGPSPPSGTHRYVFRLLALDTVLSLPASTDAAALRRAMAGHVLGEAELMGTYSRRR